MGTPSPETIGKVETCYVKFHCSAGNCVTQGTQPFQSHNFFGLSKAGEFSPAPTHPFGGPLIFHPCF
jgi:hypothetical protein